MKIKFIIDSSSGLSQQEARMFGWELMPLQSDIDGKTYQNGVNMDVEEYSKIWRANKKVAASTSMTPLGLADQIVNEFINDYDMVVIYPISKHLSSQFQMLENFYKDNPKVYVVPSNKISFLMVFDLLVAEDALKKGESFEKIKEIFAQPNMTPLLIPEFNDALVRGGRLSKTAAAVAKLLKIVPIIKFENGVLEKAGIGRVFLKTIYKSMKTMFEEYQAKADTENNYVPIIIHAASDKIDEVVTNFKEITQMDKVYVSKLSNDVAIHTGIGAIVFCIAKLPAHLVSEFAKVSEIK
ncbi:DegV family protein [Metamycoplasma arthritidis]|uniref:Hypothetical DegV family transmembrane protein n=1 Tax=Metamycoplasma arthritidis (strain 158L3-1) TaxID=243272 RepID=B3PMF9_META1|nr:DegV family protein [Metamycoplasma arthritidis]ACF07211.1 hypothetical DegV family transmembrane protein [Metamycoplasma arthritidis 158L3-1]VEU78735.1 DegV family protein [Metamycoplasma arthritidis]